SAFAFAEELTEVPVTKDPAVESTVEEVPAEEVEVEVTSEELAPVEESVDEPVAEEPVNVEFTGIEKDYVNPQRAIIGKYLQFSNNEALSREIFNLLSDAYESYDENESNVNDDVFSYNVEETLTLAKIEILERNLDTKSVTYEPVVLATYYIDKATNTEVTEEEYLATVPAEEEAPVEGEAPAEEAPVESDVPAEAPVESAVLPLRAQAEELGYVVSWENGKVTVSKDDQTAVLETGVNEYIAFDGTVLKFESAPENIDGVLYVPASFFSDVLGLTVTINTDGTVLVEIPVVDEAPVLEETPIDEEVVEEDVVEEAPVDEEVEEVVEETVVE
ncbi:MAG: copper amine oxidase N-terminal domain-containing protein, partial [Clostridiales bacterium]|nr:copper amine oxidase N-terminal domain-containing protein [Clostridiales bacterium]